MIPPLMMHSSVMTVSKNNDTYRSDKIRTMWNLNLMSLFHYLWWFLFFLINHKFFVVINVYLQIWNFFIYLFSDDLSRSTCSGFTAHQGAAAHTFGVVKKKTVSLWARECVRRMGRGTLTAIWGTVRGRGEEWCLETDRRRVRGAGDAASNLLKNCFNSLAMSKLPSAPLPLAGLKPVMVFIPHQTNLMLFCGSFSSSFLL